MPPNESQLFLRREVLPTAFHWGVLPAQFYGTDTPFPTEALYDLIRQMLQERILVRVLLRWQLVHKRHHLPITD